MSTCRPQPWPRGTRDPEPMARERKPKLPEKAVVHAGNHKRSYLLLLVEGDRNGVVASALLIGSGVESNSSSCSQHAFAQILRSRQLEASGWRREFDQF